MSTQGRENRFSVNEKVDARVAGIGGIVTVRAGVKKVLFKKQTHEVVYNLIRVGKLAKGIRKVLYLVSEGQLFPAV